MKALLCRTEFSLGESVLKADKLAPKAAEMGYEAIVVADTMSISSIIPAQLGSTDTDVKVICGVRLTIVPDPQLEYRTKEAGESAKGIRQDEFSMTLLIKNDQGFVDVCELLTLGNREEQFYFKPRVSPEQVAECFAKGNVLMLSSDKGSVFKLPTHAELLDKMIGAGNASDCVMALYPIETPLYDQINKKALEYANQKELVVAAFYPAYYETIEDADIKDFAYLVINNVKADQPYRALVPYNRESCIQERSRLLKSLKEFAVRMGVRVSPDYVSANQDLIIEQCNWRWHKLDVSLPKMADDEDKTLAELAVKGLKDRFVEPCFGYVPPESERPKYIEALKYELGILKKLGFAPYFLLVNDLIQASKTRKIPLGCGRGSVGGSVVAWSLGITETDPIRHGLLFERFINPERLDLPDADLDFSQSRRHEVLEYLESKYGEEYVAGIPNYMYLGSASALRDAGRIYGIDQTELAVTKEITGDGDNLPLEDAKEELGGIGKFAAKYPAVFDLACKLQNTMRGYGRHAAGVIVAGDKLTNRSVVERRGGERTINWDKRHCEDMGLVKLDVLGLATLDLLQLACDYVKERHGKDIDIYSVPLDDEKTLKTLSEGRTTAVFQLESSGMKKTLRDLGNGIEPFTFETVTATTALFRPGPMQSGALDTFVAVAKGYERAEAIHPLLDELLSETNGVMVYQEQTMKACQIMAGFSMAEADKVRKAMGKKDAELMAKMKASFVEGCEKVNGIPEAVAGDVWDKIEKFAGYGFNKSHSVAYSLLSFCSAYLKTYYPAEFFAAALTILGSDKHPAIVRDAREHGIEVVPPCINHSSDRLEIGYDSKREQTVLYAPFSAVKGCSAAGAKAIIEARAKCGGRFSTVEQFEEVVLKRACNARVREALRKVGAFADIDPKELDSRHPERRKDQAALMGDIMIDAVGVERNFICDAKVCAQVNALHSRIEKETELGEAIVRPTIGRKPKVMIVLDAPNGWDEKSGYIMSEGHDAFKAALTNAGFKMGDIYATSLMKIVKGKDEQFTSEQINLFKDYFAHELEYTKPTVVIAMGSLAAGYFNTSKLKPSELSGRNEYDSARDCNIIFGFNPGMLHFKPEKKTELEDICKKAYEIVNG